MHNKQLSTCTALLYKMSQLLFNMKTTFLIVLVIHLTEIREHRITAAVFKEKAKCYWTTCVCVCVCAWSRKVVWRRGVCPYRRSVRF